MKNIKNLGITTQEGFSVKNLQRFPSMEWGDEGGLQAELYYNGKEVMTVYQEGNGGCAITYLTDYGRSIEKELKEQGLRFLKRVDFCYGENTEYEWLKKKTAKNFDDDDWEAVIINIESRYDLVKDFKKILKKNYVLLANVTYTNGFSREVQSTCPIATEKHIRDYLAKQGNDKNIESIEILRIGDNVAVY